jgi:UDP-glucuronate decarboxylase
VVSNFIMQALANEPITIYGDGRQTRSFCYVEDLIDGLVRLMATPDEFTGPVNLGNPVECTMLELAELVTELTGSTAGLRFMPIPADDPVRRKPDIAGARQYLGWEPKIALTDGLQRTIRYFRDLMAMMGRDAQVQATGAAQPKDVAPTVAAQSL